MVVSEDGFCPACRLELAPFCFSLGPMPVAVCGRYDSALRRAVLGLKVVARTTYAGPMGEAMAGAAGLLGEVAEFSVVPVPSNRSRRRERGFEPAQLLAREVAQRLGLSRRELLSSQREVAVQKSLGIDARRRNVEGAFRLTAPPPAHVMLVDDVVTTGATLLECRRLLLGQGAKRVVGLCFARTPQTSC